MSMRISEAKVLFDYEKSDENQISIKAGQIITVLGKGEPGGWIRGSEVDSGVIGYLPYDFIEIIPKDGGAPPAPPPPPPPPPKAAEPEPAPAPEPEPEPEPSPKPEIKVVCRARAMFAFEGEGPNERSLAEGEIVDILDRGEAGGWCIGVDGSFPTDFLEFLDDDVNADATAADIAVKLSVSDAAAPSDAVATADDADDASLPKCVLCARGVKADQMLNEMELVWHKACFLCGGCTSTGCKRRLNKDDYVNHNKNPYCFNCYAKEYRNAKEITPVATPTASSKPTPSTVVGAATPPAPATATQGGSIKAKTVFGSAAPKCALCTKSVYKVEEVVAIGKSWHKTCFTCGGCAGDGCKRVLQRDSYLDHDGDPYCNACYSRLFKPKGFNIGSGLNTVAPPTPSEVKAATTPTPPPAATASSTQPAAEPTVSVSAAKAAFSGSNSSTTAPPASAAGGSFKKKPSFGTAAPKCSLCTKSVYKVEEVVAIGKSWHKTCFTCGGCAGNGCKRVLQRDSYVDHDGDPYCNACYGRLYRPKGFNVGAGLNTEAAAPPIRPKSLAPKPPPPTPPPPKPAIVKQVTAKGKTMYYC